MAKFTEREKMLLDIAREFMDQNERKVSMALTGSLMVKLRGYDYPGEAGDIDILCELIGSTNQLVISKSLTIIDMEADSGYPDVVILESMDPNFHFKIDVMASEEVDDLSDDVDLIDGIMCGTIKGLIEAKESYIKYDRRPESKAKHAAQLEFLKKQL